MTQYAPVFDLSDLDGSNGYRLDGPAVGAQSGSSIAYAGDLNGDGFDDMIIGASKVGNTNGEGAAYVVFGGTTTPGPVINLAVLNGDNGFELSGPAAADQVGFTVNSAGDVNGDGIDDLIVGAAGSQKSYVVFGTASGFDPNLDLTALDGTDGFRIDGGYVVAGIGDVNGDGIDDMGVGDPAGSYAGVVYGRDSGSPWDPSIAVSGLDGGNGFRFHDNAYSLFGTGIGRGFSSVGDFNGDGIDDFAVTAPQERFPHAFGAAYIVFGQLGGLPNDFDISSYANNPSHAESLKGDHEGGDLGYSICAAGDLNGDGFADVVAGGQYVLLGREQGAQLNTFDFDFASSAEYGFRVAARGGVVAGAGDVNGDGFTDLLLVNTGEYAGVYVMFGGVDVGQNAPKFDGDDGFRIDGAVDGTNVPTAAIAGDLNGDGLVDILIGEPTADNEGLANSGASYVVYGSLPQEAVNRTGSDIAQTIHGSDFDDVLSGLGGDDSLLGHDGSDTLDGGLGDDTINGGDGIDTATYASAGAGVDVTLTLGGGAATGGAGTDALVSIENVVGSAFADVLTGSSAANVLSGGDGDDMLSGLGGADTFDGGAGTDTIDGGAGDDMVNYRLATAGVTADLSGGPSDEVLISISDILGSSFADTLTGDGKGNAFSGGNGDDVLHGGGGKDVLDGEAGKDTIEGGAGKDLLTGGGGRDVFLFTALSDSRGAAADTITDLINTDLIDLSAIDADKHLAGDQAFHLVGAFTDHAGELTLAYDSVHDRTSVKGDINGDGKADFQLWLSGDHHGFGNFVL